MKITSAICKDELAKYCANNKIRICGQFTPPLEDKDYYKTLTASNWKRMDKEVTGKYDPYPIGSILRSFDCKPFDDQLRGYVVEYSGVIINVFVSGE